jgi:DNA-binding transcriptional MerR regulator
MTASSRVGASVAAEPHETGPVDEAPRSGLRIGTVAARAGVSTRTLRYYEELGILEPSGRTIGGERRYEDADLAKLDRIIELKSVVGMNLDEVKEFLASEDRILELRADYRANSNPNDEHERERRRAILEEALSLRQGLIAQLDAAMSRIQAFRSQIEANAGRCSQLLEELDSATR